MKNRKTTTEAVCPCPEPASATYRTGATRPPKSHGGIVAVLLVLIIFLSGIITVLSFTNIRLFQALKAQQPAETSPVIFSGKEALQFPEGVTLYPLGFSGQEVTPFWQTYRELPAGIYVVKVNTAGTRGLLPGDILTGIDGAAISGTEDLYRQLTDHSQGDTVDVSVYRQGKTVLLTLTIEQPQED